MNPTLSIFWRLDRPLTARSYLFWGVLLAGIKYNLDRIIATVWFNQTWTIFDRETLMLYLWQSPFKQTEKPYFLTLLIASVPFIWIGTMLTLRRLRTLGWRPFWVLLFFVPVVKFIFFAVLCLLHPYRPENVPPMALNRFEQFLDRILPRGALASAFIAIVITTGVALLLGWLGTGIFSDYGWSIFVGLPFSMGFLSSLIFGFRQERDLLRCLVVANSTVVLVGIGFVLFAIEGLICLAMAAPIAFAVATVGGILGYAVQKTFRWRAESPKLFCLAILLLPLAMGLEHELPPAPPLLEVKSSVVINAPPEKVWRNVVSFGELPPPKEMIFKLGVAYPVRAEIRSHGVGAVRHCNFSTGPFVEPIAVWDEPRLLKFSVTENPEPMQEWTPYREIRPAHLNGYLESCAGQFRLIPLDGHRTLLEGTTWYYHHLWPADYWKIWSDYIIHTIHLRVLSHVKELSERSES
jgi:uncharacterized membrane protein YhaH (DUF805 family)